MEFFKKMFKETGYNITGDEIIASYSMDYFRSMSEIYRNTSKRYNEKLFAAACVKVIDICACFFFSSRVLWLKNST